MSRIWGCLTVSIALCGMASTSAAAAVRYDFTAMSAVGVPYGRVDFTAATLVPTGITRIAADAVTRCQLTPQSALFTCLPPTLVSYDAQDSGSNDVFNFRVRDSNGSTTAIAYFFAPGAFGSTGVFNTVLLNPFQSARLTISSGVPEPATWAEIVAGLFIAGTLGRARRSRKHRDEASGVPA